MAELERKLAQPRFKTYGKRIAVHMGILSMAAIVFCLITPFTNFMIPYFIKTSRKGIVYF